MSPPSPRAATVPCAVCDGSEVLPIADRDRRGGLLHTVLCAFCGLVWVDPRPATAAIARFYAADYRLAYKGALQPKARHCHRETLRAIERAERFLAVHRPSMRVLDVGAGAGFFAYVLRRKGIDIDGIEPNEAYSTFAHTTLGLERIRRGGLHDLAASGQYDLITLNHVLEHLPDPRAALRHLHALLATGGQLLVEVPNIEATYHAPDNLFHVGHLYWFNPTTLSALALQCGFAVAELRIVPGTGHIDVRLAKRDAAPPGDEAKALLPGNAARVLSVRRAHTALRHFLSPTPYVRALAKVRRYAGEQRAIRGAGDRRAICDALCDRWLGVGA